MLLNATSEDQVGPRNCTHSSRSTHSTSSKPSARLDDCKKPLSNQKDSRITNILDTQTHTPITNDFCSILAGAEYCDEVKYFSSQENLQQTDTAFKPPRQQKLCTKHKAKGKSIYKQVSVVKKQKLRKDSEFAPGTTQLTDGKSRKARRHAVGDHNKLLSSRTKQQSSMSIRQQDKFMQDFVPPDSFTYTQKANLRYRSVRNIVDTTQQDTQRHYDDIQDLNKYFEGAQFENNDLISLHPSSKAVNNMQNKVHQVCGGTQNSMCNYSNPIQANAKCQEQQNSLVKHCYNVLQSRDVQQNSISATRGLQNCSHEIQSQQQQLDPKPTNDLQGQFNAMQQRAVPTQNQYSECRLLNVFNPRQRNCMHNEISMSGQSRFNGLKIDGNISQFGQSTQHLGYPEVVCHNQTHQHQNQPKQNTNQYRPFMTSSLYPPINQYNQNRGSTKERNISDRMVTTQQKATGQKRIANGSAQKIKLEKDDKQICIKQKRKYKRRKSTNKQGELQYAKESAMGEQCTKQTRKDKAKGIYKTKYSGKNNFKKELNISINYNVPIIQRQNEHIVGSVPEVRSQLNKTSRIRPKQDLVDAIEFYANVEFKDVDWIDKDQRFEWTKLFRDKVQAKQFHVSGYGLLSKQIGVRLWQSPSENVEQKLAYPSSNIYNLSGNRGLTNGMGIASAKYVEDNYYTSQQANAQLQHDQSHHIIMQLRQNHNVQHVDPIYKENVQQGGDFGIALDCNKTTQAVTSDMLLQQKSTSEADQVYMQQFVDTSCLQIQQDIHQSNVGELCTSQSHRRSNSASQVNQSDQQQKARLLPTRQSIPHQQLQQHYGSFQSVQEPQIHKQQYIENRERYVNQFPSQSPLNQQHGNQQQSKLLFNNFLNQIHHDSNFSQYGNMNENSQIGYPYSYQQQVHQQAQQDWPQTSQVAIQQQSEQLDYQHSHQAIDKPHNMYCSVQQSQTTGVKENVGARNSSLDTWDGDKDILNGQYFTGLQSLQAQNQQEQFYSKYQPKLNKPQQFCKSHKQENIGNSEAITLGTIQPQQNYSLGDLQPSVENQYAQTFGIENDLNIEQQRSPQSMIGKQADRADFAQTDGEKEGTTIDEINISRLQKVLQNKPQEQNKQQLDDEKHKSHQVVQVNNGNTFMAMDQTPSYSCQRQGDEAQQQHSFVKQFDITVDQPYDFKGNYQQKIAQHPIQSDDNERLAQVDATQRSCIQQGVGINQQNQGILVSENCIQENQDYFRRPTQQLSGGNAEEITQLKLFQSSYKQHTQDIAASDMFTKQSECMDLNPQSEDNTILQRKFSGKAIDIANLQQNDLHRKPLKEQMCTTANFQQQIMLENTDNRDVSDIGSAFDQIDNEGTITQLQSDYQYTQQEHQNDFQGLNTPLQPLSVSHLDSQSNSNRLIDVLNESRTIGYHNVDGENVQRSCHNHPNKNCNHILNDIQGNYIENYCPNTCNNALEVPTSTAKSSQSLLPQKRALNRSSITGK